MTAYLDTQRGYGDYAGGVSDPRLVARLDTLGLHLPTYAPGSPELTDATRTIRVNLEAYVDAGNATVQEAAELWDMLFDHYYEDDAPSADSTASVDAVAENPFYRLLAARGAADATDCE